MCVCVCVCACMYWYLRWLCGWAGMFSLTTYVCVHVVQCRRLSLRSVMEWACVLPIAWVPSGQVRQTGLCMQPWVPRNWKVEPKIIRKDKRERKSVLFPKCNELNVWLCVCRCVSCANIIVRSRIQVLLKFSEMRTYLLVLTTSGGHLTWIDQSLDVVLGMII